MRLRDEDGDGCLGELPGLLSGGHRVVDVLDTFEPRHRPAVESVLAELVEMGVVIDGARADRLGGYRTADPTIEAATAPETDGSVLVVHEGSIGPMVATDLDGAITGQVSLFAPSRPPDIPTPPASIDRLPTDRPLDEAIADVDYLVYTADRPTVQLPRAVNEATQTAAVPWISGRLAGLDGQVGPTVLPGRSACYECFHRRASGTVDEPRSFHPVERATPRPLRAHARIVAGWLVTDLLRLMSAGTGFTVGGLIHFDFLDMTVEPNPVLKLPRCPACGPHDRPTLDVKRFVDYERLLEVGP